jgi:hypothetical protein
MIPPYRISFNASYSDDRLARVRRALAERCGVPIEFHVSETPCFVPHELIERLAREARAIVGELLDNAEYLRAADAMVPERFRIPNGERVPTFLAVDFGLLRVGDELEGRLVELQAFPSLYGFQLALAETWRDAWPIDAVSVLPAGLDRERYLSIAGHAITHGHDPETVVLMDIDPAKQKTRPDFAVTEQLWGVRAVDIRDVRREGSCLTYLRDGRQTRIHRVYNRVIPDDLEKLGIEAPFDYREALDVEWCGGPDWFFRISKFSIPYLRHPWVPRTIFLDDAASLPADRDNWLLKPLFSYAGGGILFSPSDHDIAAIPADRRHLYVLQERIAFTPVIDTPDGLTQTEIRLMFVRDAGDYRFVMPLIRMGRGKMMGVDYNKGLRFVGASAALMA